MLTPASHRDTFSDFNFYSFHDRSRFAPRSSPSASTSSLAPSTCSSLRSSPLPSGPFQAPIVPYAPAHPRFSHVPREFSVLGLCIPMFMIFFFEKATILVRALLAGLPTSLFAWAVLVWDTSPRPVSKYSQITRRFHRPHHQAVISASLLPTRIVYTCTTGHTFLTHKLDSLGMIDDL